MVDKQKKILSIRKNISTDILANTSSITKHFFILLIILYSLLNILYFLL